MKLSILILLTLLSFNAWGDSLEDHFADQELITVSPVTYKGLEIRATNEGQAASMAICSMIGAKRVVSFKTKLKKITQDSFLYKAKSLSYLEKVRAWSSDNFLIVTEVTCAK